MRSVQLHMSSAWPQTNYMGKRYSVGELQHAHLTPHPAPRYNHTPVAKLPNTLTLASPLPRAHTHAHTPVAKLPNTLTSASAQMLFTTSEILLMAPSRCAASSALGAR